MRFWKSRRSALGGRIVHFPEDRSVGDFVLRPEEEFLPYNSGIARQWRPVRGDVIAPAGQAIHLWVGSLGRTDLRWLTDLAPDDVQMLHLRCSDLTDREVGYLRVLTGLKYLDLSSSPITDASLSLLVALKRLQILDLSEDTKTTQEGREELRDALPGLDILVW